jgi:hypothetical protein
VLVKGDLKVTQAEITRQVQLITVLNGDQKSLQAFKILSKLTLNIILHPQEEKYRIIKLSNKKLSVNIFGCIRMQDLLIYLGFKYVILE